MPEGTTINCLGLVMDGNRRWAKAKGLSSFEGHHAGFKKMQEVLRWVRAAGIPNVAAYAFSTENWNRSKEEVAYLMKLFRSILTDELEEFVKERVRIRFVGDRSRFSADMQTLMDRAEAKTCGAYDFTLYLLLSYGGRAEIVAATNKLLTEGKPEVSEEDFRKALWAPDMPDPDLIIRTSGEQRLSSFLPWQSVYSELFFTKTLWPDFSKEEFKMMLDEFSNRERRHGK